jgi:hypothetical protein
VEPEQTVVPPEQLSPSYMHVWWAGSQQPFAHAVPVVQHAAPLYPQLLPPSNVTVVMHLEAASAWVRQLASTPICVACMSVMPALLHFH